jgi:hypothetical protein
MDRIKISATVFFFTIALGILLPLLTAKLYPINNAIFTTGIILIILISWRDSSLQESYPAHLLFIVGLAVAYRLRTFLFPASMLGIDPDGYAIQIARVINSGETSEITFGFYSQAPFHITEGSITGLITALSAPDASAVYPLFSGIATPLLAAVFVYRLRPNSPRAAILAAGGSSVLGYSVLLSYWPIAQTTGIIFLLFGICSAFVYASSGEYRWLFILLLMMIGAIYTHKLVGIAMTLSVGGALLLALVHGTTRETATVRRLGVGTVAITAVLTVLQLFYITGFGSGTVFKLLDPETIDVAQTTSATEAVDPYQLSDRIFRIAYALLIGAVSGIIWLGWFWRTLRDESPVRDVVFLGLVAPLGGLVVLFFPLGANIIRAIHYGEALFIVLIVVGWYWFSSVSKRHLAKMRSYAAVGGIILLIATAGLSPIAGPDWGVLSRDYLTAEEVEAKEWGNKMMPGEITADQYYAGETPPHAITEVENEGAIRTSKFISDMEPYLNNNFSEADGEYIASRGCIRILRSSFGPWQLNYDLYSTLQQTYSQVYSSNCISYYSK